MENTFKNDQIVLENLPSYESLVFEPVSIKQRVKALISLSISLVAVLTGLGIWFFYDSRDLVLYIAVAVLLFFSFQYFLVVKRQQCYGYALRERDIAFKRGYLFRKTTIIPFNRIQHVSTAQGVLDKLLKISTLQIFTAGGSGSDINIPGLEPQLAAVIKEAIVQKVDNVRI